MADLQDKFENLEETVAKWRLFKDKNFDAFRYEYVDILREHVLNGIVTSSDLHEWSYHLRNEIANAVAKCTNQILYDVEETLFARMYDCVEIVDDELEKIKAELKERASQPDAPFVPSKVDITDFTVVDLKTGKILSKDEKDSIL